MMDRPVFMGQGPTPGVNLDRIDVGAGLREAASIGYDGSLWIAQAL
jgi:hypothetical protein